MLILNVYTDVCSLMIHGAVIISAKCERSEHLEEIMRLVILCVRVVSVCLSVINSLRL